MQNEFRSVIYVTRSVHSVSMCVYTVCNTHNTPACVYAICINLRKFLFEIAIDCGAKIGDFWWIDAFFFTLLVAMFGFVNIQTDTRKSNVRNDVG